MYDIKSEFENIKFADNNEILFESNERIGQHFLIDREVIANIVDLIPRGSTCVEIGAGPGTLTDGLVKNEDHVIAFEIDEKFKPALDAIADHGDLNVEWQNFLCFSSDEINRLKEYHIVGNIPFHISEPLLLKFTDLRFETAILLVGDHFAHLVSNTNPSQQPWSRMSLVANAFFEVEKLQEVPRSSFSPQPRADGALIKLTRKDAANAWQTDTVTRAYRALVEADKENSTVAKALKKIMVNGKGEVQGVGNKIKGPGNNKVQRSMVRIALREYTDNYNCGSYTGKLGMNYQSRIVPSSLLSLISPSVDEKILSKPLSGINNHELQKVCSVISAVVNRLKKLPSRERIESDS